MSENIKTDINLYSKRIRRMQSIKKYLFIFSIIGVQLIFFCIFYIAVNTNAILLAFQNTKIGGEIVFTLDNFRLFFENFNKISDIGIALRNTMIYFLFGWFMLPISFTVSYFLYKKVWGYKLFRILFFFPTVLSAVVWSNIYINIVGIEGPIAALYQKIYNLQFPPHFLGDKQFALTFVILYSFWVGFAGNFVLFSGALVRIPESVIEAGKIDGLGWFRELTRVIVPLVWPTLSTIMILSLTGIFTSSGNILLLTYGNHDTKSISYMIFQMVYNDGNAEAAGGAYGYASAVGLIFTVLTLPIVAVKLLGKVEDVKY
jgi:ABC-type sugar transport system permease subunit